MRLGFGVRGSGFTDQGLGFPVAVVLREYKDAMSLDLDLWSWSWVVEFRVWELGFEDLGCRVSGLGFRV